MTSTSLDSGHIKTGSQLALQKRIDTFCPQMKMAMASFASQLYADYHDYLFREQKQAEASALGVPSTGSAPSSTTTASTPSK